MMNDDQRWFPLGEIDGLEIRAEPIESKGFFDVVALACHIADLNPLRRNSKPITEACQP